MNLINVGDVFETKSSDHLYSKEKIIIKKVENATSKDGWGYFDTKELYHRRKYNYKARIWWFMEFCKKIKFAENKENGK